MNSNNLNELREELRNSQLESLKGLATTLLEAPLENDYNLILISGTKENVRVEAKTGGGVLNVISLVDSLLDTTHNILSEVPKEYLGEAFKHNKLLLLKILALNGAIFEKLSEITDATTDEE